MKRPSLAYGDPVLRASNQTPNRLSAMVTLHDAKGVSKRSGMLDLDPNGLAELGWMEGWSLATGDRITVPHPSYRGFVQTVP